MRIIVWGINYVPELTGIAPFNTGLCDAMRERGHEVEMVTSFPYYPFWRKLPGDERRLFRTDDVDGVVVHRCWHYVPSRISTLKRIVHELTFGITSFCRVMFLSRPDVYVVISPPLLLGPLVAMLAWLKRRPYVFHVQDLQPDAAVGLGMVTPGRFVRFLYRIEALTYRRASRVSGISQAMIAAFERKGVPAAKRVLFPNWLRWLGRNVEAEEVSVDAALAAAFRRRHGIPETAFLATYSGNLGRKQGLETLVAAAARLVDRHDIRILVVGDGVMRVELERQIAASGATNVRMMPLLAEPEYHAMVAASQLSLILQSPGSGQYFLPSKLLSVLAIGSPVLTAADADSELAKAVEEGGFGVNVAAGDPDKLADELGALSREPARLQSLRRRTQWVRRFSAGGVLGAFEQELLTVVHERH